MYLWLAAACLAPESRADASDLQVKFLGENQFILLFLNSSHIY